MDRKVTPRGGEPCINLLALHACMHIWPLVTFVFTESEEKCSEYFVSSWGQNTLDFKITNSVWGRLVERILVLLTLCAL